MSIYWPKCIFAIGMMFFDERNSFLDALIQVDFLIHCITTFSEYRRAYPIIRYADINKQVLFKFSTWSMFYTLRGLRNIARVEVVIPADCAV